MTLPPIPKNESTRLKELSLLKILDTLPEREYDAITEMAAELCDVPISLITLIDHKRQWFKSLVGVNFSETPRELAFCAHAINSTEEIFEVTNAKEDARFYDNPFVATEGGIVFYAGVPLVSNEGNAFGTLCVLDNKPKKLSKSQRKALLTLAIGVVKLLELRKKTMQVEEQNENLKRKNDLLNDFANVVSHDLKSPLNNIIGLANVLKESDEPSPLLINKFGTLILDSAESLKILIEDVLEYAKSDILLNQKQEELSIKSVVQDCANHYKELPGVNLILQEHYPTIHGHRAAWKQILYNLVSNAVKHNDKEVAEIKIAAVQKGNYFQLTVGDNGPGIPENKKDKIFEPLVTLGGKSRKGEASSGIGLATLKKLVTAMEGKVEIKVNEINGSDFIISVPHISINFDDSKLKSDAPDINT